MRRRVVGVPVSRAWIAAAVIAVVAASCALPFSPVAPRVVGPGRGTGEVSSRPGVAAAGTPARCDDPAVGGDFDTADPASVQLDPTAVRDAIDYATRNLAASVRIYRHDCLVGQSGADGDTRFAPANLWSATKGVVSILVGRAVEMGKLSVDDPIGRYLPQADAAHGAITVRELLTQSSGLRFHWANDVAAGGEDSVDFTLSLPFDHAPGTYFEYAQTTVTTLGAVVEAAVGEDLQAFADQQLFTPLGIPRTRWSWMRDEAGHTYGFAMLAMAPVDLARIGTLLEHDGRWGDRQLLSPSYVRAMGSSSATNPGYGYLLWTNQGDSFITPSALARRTKDRPWLPAAPRDLYALSGMFDQLVWIIPSLDMVIVRTGFFGESNWQNEFFRILMRGVRDATIPDPGPLPYEPIADLSEWGSLLDLASWPGLTAG
jgi:CubicO group peptidase (beta-lactamase class C family)